MNVVYLCLGGNLSDCLMNFRQTYTLIEEKAVNIVSYSSLYQSKAWGMQDAPDFLNQVIKVETELSAMELMPLLLGIEEKLGRVRSSIAKGYQNRIIDIDILLFNEEGIKTESLEIPHPRMHLRRFALEPLQEIAPEFIHPLLKKNITELLTLCPDTLNVKKLAYAA